MLWCVDRSSVEERVRRAAERAATVKLPLLTKNEALEASLVEALGFEVDEIVRSRGLSYVKVRFCSEDGIRMMRVVATGILSALSKQVCHKFAAENEPMHA